MKKHFYLCSFIHPERGFDEKETTIVEASDKTAAVLKATRKIKKCLGAKAGGRYTAWAVKQLQTTF